MGTICDTETTQTQPHHDDSTSSFHFNDNVVPLTFCDTTVCSLLDSGAAINCISLNTLHRIQPNPIILPATGSFKTASSAPIIATGKITLSFTLGTHCLTEDFHVFPSLTQPIILGRPFLSHTKAIMDFEKDTLTISTNYGLQLPSDITLHPHSTSLIQCLVNGPLLPNGLTVSTPHTHHKGLEIEESLMQISENKVPLVITNNTDTKVELSETHEIASLHLMSRDQLTSTITEFHINAMSYEAPTISDPYTTDWDIQEEDTGPTDLWENNDYDSNAYFTLPHTSPMASYPACATENAHHDIQVQARSSSIDHTETANADGKTPSLSLEQKQQHLKQEYNITFPTNLSTENLHTLIEVLYRNRKAFIDSSGRIGYNDTVPHVIKIKEDAIPITKQPYRFAPDIKRALQEEIDKLLALNIIERKTNTWSSPIIPVKKQQHSKSSKHLTDPSATPQYRLCLDLRYVNACSIPYVTHINTIPDIIDALGEIEPSIFSSADLKMAFFQQALAEESRQYCGFLFNGQSYQFRSCPQGLASSPFLFQKLMNTVLEKPIETGCCHVYLDDILIATKDFNSHMHVVDMVLSALIEANLKLCAKKCIWDNLRSTF